MINRKFFFDHARATLFGGKLTASQVAGMTDMLNEWETGNWGSDTRLLAYMFATSYHETDKKMQPIEEYGKGKGRTYGKRIKQSGKPYTDTTNLFYGRGDAQLTWYENYDKASLVIGLNLIQEPNLALDSKVSKKIMFHGMTKGWFTGKKLSDYFAGAKQDWFNARRIINGTDKAQLVAGHAQKFYACISVL